MTFDQRLKDSYSDCQNNTPINRGAGRQKIFTAKLIPLVMLSDKGFWLTG
jgi:hypothetical protein